MGDRLLVNHVVKVGQRVLGIGGGDVRLLRPSAHPASIRRFNPFSPKVCRGRGGWGWGSMEGDFYRLETGAFARRRGDRGGSLLRSGLGDGGGLDRARPGALLG